MIYSNLHISFLLHLHHTRNTICNVVVWRQRYKLRPNQNRTGRKKGEKKKKKAELSLSGGWLFFGKSARYIAGSWILTMTGRVRLWPGGSVCLIALDWRMIQGYSLISLPLLFCEREKERWKDERIDKKIPGTYSEMGQRCSLQRLQ